MTCSVKVVQLNEIYMCTEFHMNTCKYVWAIHQVFWLCSRGRRRAPVPHPGPSLCGVLMAADSNVCANFQEFLSTLRPPKVPGRLKKKKKKKNNNPLENNRALRLTGLGPNNNNPLEINRALRLTGLGPKYSCKQRWRAQAVSATATPVASRKRGTASTCIYSNPLAVWF